MINRGSPIPELINLIKHSFRECEFDEVQNTLMEREKIMKVEMENVVRDRDSLKKQVDILENTHGYMELEKIDLEEKLRMSQRRGKEMDEMIVQMKQKFEKLWEEMDERFIKMRNEFEELRQESIYANKTMEEMKAKEIEADCVVQEMKRKNVEAVQIVDELRAKKMKSKKANVEDRAIRLTSDADAGVTNLPAPGSAVAEIVQDKEGKEPKVQGFPSKPSPKNSKSSMGGLSESGSDKENEEGSSVAEKLRLELEEKDEELLKVASELSVATCRVKELEHQVASLEDFQYEREANARAEGGRMCRQKLLVTSAGQAFLKEMHEGIVGAYRQSSQYLGHMAPHIAYFLKVKEASTSAAAQGFRRELNVKEIMREIFKVIAASPEFKGDDSLPQNHPWWLPVIQKAAQKLAFEGEFPPDMPPAEELLYDIRQA
ncbi:protein CROWDED NUCLEI 1-like isoform X2 [Salvia miltiorrhiza]|uniref:protein CROWDED NUCLEI 1-like isoform X2 n=1 Tax=Salvia miltiorrhiza TaxID=226208 RepID=UPI0025ABD129|nr:protein CROWDED NUCLEI 1-like isoform X2 [Salvia miltiorrhiza]